MFYLSLVFDLFFALFLAFFGGDMIGVNQSTVKTVNIHQSKSDVVKVDGMKNCKSKGNIGKTRTDGCEGLKKNQCAYCKEV